MPVGEFIYLPTARIIGYSPLNASSDLVHESAANSASGVVEIEPKDINYNDKKIVHPFAQYTIKHKMNHDTRFVNAKGTIGCSFGCSVAFCICLKDSFSASISNGSGPCGPILS